MEKYCLDFLLVAFYRNLRQEWNKVDDNSLDSTTKRLPRNYQETTKTKKEMIKDIMRDNPLASAAMIAEQVGLSESGVQYHIKKMKAIGEIKRLGSDKGGQWKVND